MLSVEGRGDLLECNRGSKTNKRAHRDLWLDSECHAEVRLKVSTTAVLQLSAASICHFSIDIL